MGDARERTGKGGRPTREDVARLLNISGSTVSRVLSGRTDLQISAEMRAKVVEAAQRLGYAPNLNARALKKGRSGLVAFWMTLQYSPYSGQVLNAMRRLLADSGMALAVSDVDEEFEREGSFSQALRIPSDGIIAFDNSRSIEAFAAQKENLASGVPFVGMGAFWSESLSYVGVDLYAGASAAMHHLFETGRRRIAYLAPFNSRLGDRGARFEAYRDEMDARGLTKETLLVLGPEVREVRDALVERFRREPLPEALLCMNDELALATVASLQHLGIRPGIDVGVVGFDGIRETDYALCSITTVRQPVEQMCALALDYLKAQIDDPFGPLLQTVLSPELVVRESTLPKSVA